MQLTSAGNGPTGRHNFKQVTDDSWTEAGITYTNAPVPGTSIGTHGPTAVNTRYSVPLTVTGLAGEAGQQLCLAIGSSSSDGLILDSKEAGNTLDPGTHAGIHARVSRAPSPRWGPTSDTLRTTGNANSSCGPGP